jgi:hypothetical protein
VAQGQDGLEDRPRSGPALKPLPATRYQFGEWKSVRVNLDYHVEVERHYYSVPYALVHQKVIREFDLFSGLHTEIL